MRTVAAICTIIISAFFGHLVVASDDYGLDDQIQKAKKEAIDISSELMRLEEKLLYPSTTQTTFFVSLGTNVSLEPVSISLSVNGVKNAHYMYSFREIEAFKSGGMQRLEVMNLPQGVHKVTADVVFKNSADKLVSQQYSYELTKSVGPQLVELRLADGQSAIVFREL